MRLLVTTALWTLLAGAAAASVQTIGDVQSASAVYSSQSHAIIVSAKVGLPNSCWSNPRIVAPPASARPDADGGMRIDVVADSAERPGVMCAMIFRPNVAARPLRWTRFPHVGLKTVTLVGTVKPQTTPVVWSGQPHP